MTGVMPTINKFIWGHLSPYVGGISHQGFAWLASTLTFPKLADGEMK